jgi:Tfp pilus assembly PilM family ATPase
MRGAGFDIGGRALTLAVVNRGLKGVRIERAITRRVPEGAEGPVEMLRALAREAAPGVQPVALGVPVHAVSARAITLPFTQREKLDAVLPSELEGQLPFELDEVVVAASLVSQAEGRSRLLAAAVPKTTLRARLEEAARAGLDPRVVTVDAEALAHAAEVWLPLRPDLALIHLDDRWISVALLDGRRLRAMRGVPWDGEAAWRAAAESGIEAEAFDDADRASAPRAAAALGPALRTAVDELRRTLHADAVDSGRRVGAMALSGLWSDLPEVGAFLADALGLELVAWPSVPIGGAPRPLAPVALAAGLALAGLARDRGRIDFRRGEFAYGRERAGVRKRAMTAGVMAALVLAAGIADLGVRAAGKERRYREVQDRVRAAFQDALPGVTTIVSEPDQLQAAIDMLAKQRAFLGGEVGALDILLKLTDAIPKDSGVAVSDLTIDQDKVRIEAETASFDWVNRIEGALSKAPFVDRIVVSDAKTTADQSKVRFLMTITLREGV